MPACARWYVSKAARSPPRQRSAPRCTRVNPNSVTSSVVLPTPLRPSSARLSPSRSVNEMSSSTTEAPYPAVTPSSASRSAMLRLAEIDLLDARIPGDLLRRAFRQHLATDEYGDAFGEAEHEIHVVLDEQHGHIPRQLRD